MRPSFYPLRNCWRVRVPASEYRLKDGILADVAPTLLDLLGLPIPKEMTGHSLLERVE